MQKKTASQLFSCMIFLVRHPLCISRKIALFSHRAFTYRALKHNSRLWLYYSSCCYASRWPSQVDMTTFLKFQKLSKTNIIPAKQGVLQSAVFTNNAEWMTAFSWKSFSLTKIKSFEANASLFCSTLLLISAAWNFQKNPSENLQHFFSYRFGDIVMIAENVYWMCLSGFKNQTFVCYLFISQVSRAPA